MKKFLLGVLALLGTTGLAQAQDVFGKGDKMINLGLGLGSSFGSLSLPPISASFDYGVADNLINGDNGSISVGAQVGFAGSKYANIGLFGARGAFHYQFAPKLDTYAGLMLGYNYVNWKTGYDASFYSYDSFGYNVFIGARYFFTDKIGAFAELGYGISYTTMGPPFLISVLARAAIRLASHIGAPPSTLG